MVCHFLQLHGKADETFPAVADILAIGCLLAIFEQRLPKVTSRLALFMVCPVVLVPVYMGVLRFRTTPLLLLLFWPASHFSIAGLLLHAIRRPYWILNAGPVAFRLGLRGMTVDAEARIVERDIRLLRALFADASAWRDVTEAPVSVAA